MDARLRQHWTLDPEITFLNHGSFGACPSAVMEVANAVRAELEREPVWFFSKLEGKLDDAREDTARFVGARPEDLVFVKNATAGVNAVLRSLELRPGDALLTTDHAYNACRNALEFVAARASAEIIVVAIPVPVRDPEEITARILAAATPRVRIGLVDHVTSPTGIVFPIAEIVARLRERGIETIVDGAHAPGMLPLALEELGAGYYTGNFHKWVCAPKGAGMLVVRSDLQSAIHPAVISHGFSSTRSRSRYLEEFDWTGSDDPSAWLAVPSAIRFMGGLVEGGWPAVYARNHALAIEARRILLGALGGEPLAPDSMLGSLAALSLPDATKGAAASPSEELLHCRLFSQHRIEVPVFPWPLPPKRLVRISAQLYNTLSDYVRLADALRIELAPAGA